MTAPAPAQAPRDPAVTAWIDAQRQKMPPPGTATAARLSALLFGGDPVG